MPDAASYFWMSGDLLKIAIALKSIRKEVMPRLQAQGKFMGKRWTRMLTEDDVPAAFPRVTASDLLAERAGKIKKFTDEGRLGKAGKHQQKYKKEQKAMGEIAGRIADTGAERDAFVRPTIKAVKRLAKDEGTPASKKSLGKLQEDAHNAVLMHELHETLTRPRDVIRDASGTAMDYESHASPRVIASEHNMVSSLTGKRAPFVRALFRGQRAGEEESSFGEAVRRATGGRWPFQYGAEGGKLPRRVREAALQEFHKDPTLLSWRPEQQ